MTLGYEAKKFLHTHLVLGQTRWVCRYGTLSDAHEHITPAQRYYQAIKMRFHLSESILSQKAVAMKAQANLMDAIDLMKKVKKPSDKLRAEAAKTEAENSLRSSLITIEDQERMVDEYTKVINELGPEVEARYPGGIEQAEPDNWEAVAKYRAKLQKMGRESNPHFAVLDPFRKAEIGVETGTGELTAWLGISEERAIKEIAGGDIEKALEMRRGMIKRIDQSKQAESNNLNQGVKQ